MTHLREMMLEELERCNYSQTTIDSFLRFVAEFSLHFPPSEPLYDRGTSYSIKPIYSPTKASTEHCDAAPRRFAIF
jgi:hypothetical protein